MRTEDSILGKWTYRSFRNDPNPIDDNGQKALDLLFAEGTIAIQALDRGLTKATLSWGGQVQMILSGRVYLEQGIAPATLLMTGTGIENGATQGWVYQYQGYLVPTWPGSVDQVQTIVGSVMRTVRHGSGAAGYVASFVMVKQPA